MPRPRSLRTLTLNQNATAVTPGPPSPTLSEATQASQMNFGTAGPEKIITRGDLKTSLQAYENVSLWRCISPLLPLLWQKRWRCVKDCTRFQLLGASASYRDALMHMSKATAGLADAMSACARCAGFHFIGSSAADMSIVSKELHINLVLVFWPLLVYITLWETTGMFS